MFESKNRYCAASSNGGKIGNSMWQQNIPLQPKRHMEVPYSNHTSSSYNQQVAPKNAVAYQPYNQSQRSGPNGNFLSNSSNVSRPNPPPVPAVNRNPYIGVPLHLLYCHVCDKILESAEIFSQHLEDLKHKNQLIHFQSTHDKAIYSMRQDIQNMEKQKHDDIELKRRQGIYVPQQGRQWCHICLVNFYGEPAQHFNDFLHKKLQETSEFHCRICNLRFNTRTQWDCHQLSACHLQWTAMEGMNNIEVIAVEINEKKSRMLPTQFAENNNPLVDIKRNEHDRNCTVDNGNKPDHCFFQNSSWCITCNRPFRDGLYKMQGDPTRYCPYREHFDSYLKHLKEDYDINRNQNFQSTAQKRSANAHDCRNQNSRKMFRTDSG